MSEMPYEMEARRLAKSMHPEARRGTERGYPHQCRGAACPAFAICDARRAAAAGRIDEGYPAGGLV